MAAGPFARGPFVDKIIRVNQHPSDWQCTLAESLGVVPHYQSHPPPSSQNLGHPMVELNNPGDSEAGSITLLPLLPPQLDILNSLPLHDLMDAAQMKKKPKQQNDLVLNTTKEGPLPPHVAPTKKKKLFIKLKLKPTSATTKTTTTNSPTAKAKSTTTPKATKSQPPSASTLGEPVTLPTSQETRQMTYVDGGFTGGRCCERDTNKHGIPCPRPIGDTALIVIYNLMMLTSKVIRLFDFVTWPVSFHLNLIITIIFHSQLPFLSLIPDETR